MPTLKADNKLREMCLKQEGVILITENGRQDKIFRVTPSPDFIKNLIKERKISDGADRGYAILDLNIGPHQEIWSDLKRLILVGAPRDRAIPEPRNAAEKPGDPWDLSPEDVPHIELQQYAVEKPSTVITALPAAPNPIEIQKPNGEVAKVIAEALKDVKKEPKELLKCEVPGCPVVCKGAFGMKVHRRRAHSNKE